MVQQTKSTRTAEIVAEASSTLVFAFCKDIKDDVKQR
jgi:hypothetical protein